MSFRSIIAVAVVAALLGGVAGGGLALRYGSNFGPAPSLGQPSGAKAGPVSTALPSSSTWPVVGIAEAVAPSVVAITNRQQVRGWYGPSQLADVGKGSGVIFDSRGYIVTNYHVIDRASQIMVSLGDGKAPIQAKLMGGDSYSDVAVLKVDAGTLPAATFGDSSTLKVGELAVAIGNAVGEFERTVTAGVISGLNRTVQVQDDYGRTKDMTVIQTDAAINEGNSGGPLVNEQGQIIGINTIKIGQIGVEGLGFAIPINTVRQIVDQLVTKGSVVWPYLGVTLVDKDQAAVRLNVNFDHGVLAYDVVANGPSAGAGIKKNDIILSIDGKAVESSSEIRSLIRTYQVGAKVAVVVLRNGAQQTFTVTLGEAPATN
ncbi:MAG TPA: trypsin-like peptidase domain-containing protein [Bacillota bacterium]|jgi:serine protease Do